MIWTSLVNPGQIPSPHVHQIVGGNSFNATMTTEDVSAMADCTTCAFSEDFSNYWTANMYFKARNGTYKRVPQMGNPCVPLVEIIRPTQRLTVHRLQFNDNFSTQTDGGILVYYVSAAPGDITAFQPVCLQ